MNNYEPLTILPVEFQTKWMAQLYPATANTNGSFRLVNIRKTQPGGYEENRLIVLVVDENGFPIPGVKVAFAYSTASRYVIEQSFTWMPPPPHLAHIVPTEGGGQIEQIQGSFVKEAAPGGITVYCLEPEYSSDYITGMGSLADHTGVHLTFQLRRAGVVPIAERLQAIEDRLAALEAK